MADWYFRNQQSKVRPCPGCRNLVGNNEEYCPYCARRLKPASGPRAGLQRLLNQPFIATRFLLVLIAAAFVVQTVLDLFLPPEFQSPSRGGIFNLLTANSVTYIRLGSNFHPFVAYFHQYWRWLTYCFLHFGLLHIGFNCWAFWDLGRLAERLWGPRQVFTTFILTGITGGIGSYTWNMLMGSPSNSAGASGAICGILGLLLGAYYKNRYQVGEFLGSQLVRWAVMILVFGLVAGADNAAHIGGMLGGAALGYFLPPTNHSRTLERDMTLWNGGAILSLGLLVISIVFAAISYLQGPDMVEAMFRAAIIRR